jgi:hypothetical protein
MTRATCYGVALENGVRHMKTMWSVVFVLWVLGPSLSFAEDFLGAPVMPDGKTVSQTNERLEKTYHVPYQTAVKYYEEALKELKDVKFRDRGGEMYIEDHSNRPWHAITVSKVANDRTDIVFTRDNWTWIFGTLVLRFIGVFVVLVVLYIALSISGAIISRTVKVAGKKT